MKPYQIFILIAGCIVFSGATLLPSVDTEKQLRSGDMLAAVKSSSAPSGISSLNNTINRSINSVLNIFTRKKEPYLNLVSPYFNYITILSSTTPKTSPSMSPQDILTVTNVQPLNHTVDIKNSLVNIFCSQKVGSQRKVVTGSGVLIKENLVLTDAHVAVYPLIADSNSAILCLARTGSPAQATHSIKVVFISPEWIKNNGSKINTAYTETGEDDYALLKITPLAKTAQPRKNTLTPLRIQDNVSGAGSPIKVTAYPANIFGSKGVDAPLHSQTENLITRSILSFTDRNLDMIETSISTIGQNGSSGGALTNQNNELIGLISTVVDPGAGLDAMSGGKLIHGLTISNINRSIDKYSSGGLSKLILLGTESLENYFNQNQRNSLTSIIARALSL